MKRNGGFTLIELLAVATLLLVLLALAVPIAGNLSRKNQALRCVSNLRQIGVASGAFAAEHRGIMPHFYYDTAVSSKQAPNAVTGQWYWHLAPYLNIPRWENARMNLGEQGSEGIGPCVFTCPAANSEREDIDARFLTYPNQRPVSYAPSSKSQGDAIAPPGNLAMPAQVTAIYPVRLASVRNPGAKIWISDAVGAGVLNITTARWAESYGRGAWPYQSFTRHQGGGNALFYDGHVAWVPITRFQEPPEGTLPKALSAVFDPTFE